MKLPEGYRARPASIQDASIIAELQNAHSVSVVGKPTSAADLVRTGFQSPAFRPGRDTRLVLAEDGEPAGCVQIWDSSPHVQQFANVAIHPDHTGRGLGSAVATWSEDRARESIPLAPDGARIAVGQEIWTQHTAAMDLLCSRGYQVTRHFSRQVVPLGGSLPALVPPRGITIREFRGQVELEQLARADVDAFRDHWGYVEQPFEDELKEWVAWIETSERYDPTQWLLAIEGEEIVGLAIAEGAMDEDPKMAYVADLGVRRPWRRRGVGTALLLRLLRVLQSRGFERAALDVDSDSLTGATRLYERIGFRTMRQSSEMELTLRPGQDLRTLTAPG